LHPQPHIITQNVPIQRITLPPSVTNVLVNQNPPPVRNIVIQQAQSPIQQIQPMIQQAQDTTPFQRRQQQITQNL
jgi:hypothetical protein